jgi:hypothetical protein
MLERCVVAGASVPSGLAAENAVLIPAGAVRAGDNARVTGDVAVFPISR